MAKENWFAEYIDMTVDLIVAHAVDDELQKALGQDYTNTFFIMESNEEKTTFYFESEEGLKMLQDKIHETIGRITDYEFETYVKYILNFKRGFMYLNNTQLVKKR